MYQKIRPIRTADFRDELAEVKLEGQHTKAITFLYTGLNEVAQAMALRQLARDARWNIAYVESRIFDVESDKARLMASYVGSEVQDDRLQKINAYTAKLHEQYDFWLCRLAHVIPVFEELTGEAYHDEAPKPNANQGEVNAQTAAALEARELTERSQAVIARRQRQEDRLDAMQRAVTK